jgi:hypothetical protein
MGLAAAPASADSGQATTLQSHHQDTPKPALRLSIGPERESYDSNDGKKGTVVIIALLENLGEEDVLLAHPNICFPKIPEEGERLTLDDNKSHLSVTIRNPDGTSVYLRNNRLRFFEPGNKDHLIVKAGESQEVRLGWFGPYFSLGQWVGIDQPLFVSQGAYQVRVTYKNAYPVAYIFDGQGKRVAAEPWIGVLQSDLITVQVE